MSTSTTVRPTKKQRDLLTYIEQFIGEHGYSPSYREIMNGLNYTSVATVALHVNSLISRGHLRKRDRSARSLEVAEPSAQTGASVAGAIKPGDEKWLVSLVEQRFAACEQAAAESDGADDEAAAAPEVSPQDLQVLVQALRILGLDAAASSFAPRLSAIINREDS